ncbi:putative dehydrogenase [Triangularia verruculosa]|uniref:Dehydrogenase n=1 Tax=Triangularia verruculosa TaxID=2587418 RepID=A0AAN6XDI8_9PEZI|nr:putative dehydrogenase [Triangularia verruculosa]
MGRFFITGSSDGLGARTASKLISQGHHVVLHARNAQRAEDARRACPGAETVLIADLSSIEETKQLAKQASELGPYEAVIHNAGVYTGMETVPGKSGLPTLFTVNTLAPYILTALMGPEAQKRLVFVSSELHAGGRPRLGDTEDIKKSGYGDSKLHSVILAKAFARLWPTTRAYSVHPGWVPTKMGGPNATGDMDLAVDTFVMVATGGQTGGKGETEEERWTPGGYFAALKEEEPSKIAGDHSVQDGLLAALETISGIKVSV